MTKTDNALRTELEELKNEIYTLNEKFESSVKRERVRVDRVVQVLLNNLPSDKLASYVTFSGRDCCDNYRHWGSGCGYTLQEFLLRIIDP